MEEYRNRPGGAEEREATQKRIAEDREKCRDFGAPAPRSKTASSTDFPAIDCREGVKVCGGKEDDIVVQELQLQKRRRMQERCNRGDRRAPATRREESKDSGVEVGERRRRQRQRPGWQQRLEKKERTKERKETPAESTSARGGERGQLEAGSQGRSGRSEHGEEERSRAAKEERQRRD